MKLSEFRRLAPWSHGIGLTRVGAEMLLADIDAEIAKARGENTGHDLVTRSLAKRIADLESSEVELREHCQGNVPMSVFKALAERVQVLEASRGVSKFDEDDAYKAWRREPWPDPHVGDGMKFEQAFREGFRAGRK